MQNVERGSSAAHLLCTAAELWLFDAKNVVAIEKVAAAEIERHVRALFLHLDYQRVVLLDLARDGRGHAGVVQLLLRGEEGRQGLAGVLEVQVCRVRTCSQFIYYNGKSHRHLVIRSRIVSK